MIRSTTLEHFRPSESRPSRDLSTDLEEGQDLTSRARKGGSVFIRSIRGRSHAIPATISVLVKSFKKGLSHIHSDPNPHRIPTHDPSLPACFLVFCLALCVPSCSHVRCWGSDGAGTGDSVLLDLWPGPRPDCLGESGELQTCLPSVRHVLSGAQSVRVLRKSFSTI